MSKKNSGNSVTFYCFTPLVSLATFLIEVAFIVYIFLRYKRTHFSLLTCFILFLLALFQISEFMICTSSNLTLWGKIGLSSTMLLPAAGIHIVSIVSKRHLWTIVGYALGTCLILAILFLPQVSLTASCYTNYVDIYTTTFFTILYSIYYSALLLIGIAILIQSVYKRIGDKKEEEWLLIGYLAFYVPSLILFFFKVIRHTALPSVMCGFALLTAVIFTSVLLPRYYHLLKRKKHR